MALGETARLLAVLEMRNDMSRGVGAALKDVNKLDSTWKRLGARVSVGGAAAVRNIGKIGVAAAGFVGFEVMQGIQSLAQLEDATTAVDGAIKQMGLTGKVTSGQIATWANQIESAVQAAFDDKDITAATANLIRFGKVTPQNIQPAMVVMTDLAAKTGDVSSASQLLAKALADPEKAAGKLAKTGVILTKEQQDQIKAMVEAGNTAGAQAYLLDQLAKSTKGAAAASKGPFNDALNILKDTVEDVQRLLGTAFLPILEKVETKLTGALQDPQFMNDVKQFGQSAADFLSKALDAADKIPWNSVADAFKLMGQGAKAALDLFTGMPPWVQTAVLTGWGLNKLTGGALTGIASELGKGLIKGVLGITAGTVVVKAGTVTGAGTAGGVGAGAGVGVGGLLKGLAIGVGGALVVELIAQQFGELERLTAAASAAVEQKIAGITDNNLSTSLSEIAGLDKTINNNSRDLVQAVLMQTGTGRKENIDAFNALAANLQKTAQTPAERAAGVTALEGLARTIADKYTMTKPDSDALYNQLVAILGTLKNPPPTPPPTGSYKNSEWGAMTQSSERTAEGVDELNRINQQAENQLGQMASGLNGLQAEAKIGRAAFAAEWSRLQGAVEKHGEAARREIAKGLGITVRELVQLRHVARTNIAGALDISVQEFIKARRQAHGDDAILAEKLGITTDELATIRANSRTTAANTGDIVDKNWSPTINVPVSVQSSFTVSGRAVATSVEKFWNRSRPRVV